MMMRCFKHIMGASRLFSFLHLKRFQSCEKLHWLTLAQKTNVPEELRDLVCNKLKLVSKDDPWSGRVDFLIEVMVSFFEKQQSRAMSHHQMNAFLGGNMEIDNSEENGMANGETYVDHMHTSTAGDDNDSLADKSDNTAPIDASAQEEAQNEIQGTNS